MMENKSQRNLLQYKKDQAGCIRGFINIFGFRNAQSSRKLPADIRQASGQIGSNLCMKLTVPNPSETVSSFQDDDESEAATLDSKTSVKELMEEDMFGEPSLMNQRSYVEIEPEVFNSDKGSHRSKNCKRTYKTYDISRSLSLSDLDDVKNVGSHDDLQIMMEEHGQIHLKTNSFREKDVQPLIDNKQSDRLCLVLEEKLCAAIEMFVNQEIKSSRNFEENEITDNSKELMDALQTLISNKELCWRLFQDPNSSLMKHLESLEDRIEKGQKSNSRLKSNLMQKNAFHAKSDELINKKLGHFFSRRSKSQESYPVMEDERSQHSCKIVILKPGPSSKLQNGKNSSHFSFVEIKRRLKKAMGKERQEVSHEAIIHKKHHDIDKANSRENIGWSSPNRNHFYIERFAKPPVGFERRDRKGKPGDVKEATINEAANRPKMEISDIYLEAKKHLLEMFNSGEKEEEFIREKLPKSLGRILSLPEYNTSPKCRPRKCKDEQILSPRTRVAPSDEEINYKQYIQLGSANLDIQCEIHCDNLLEKVVSSTKDEVAVAGVLYSEKPNGYQEDGKVSDYASCGSADVIKAFTTETSLQSFEFASECLLDSCGAKEILSGSSPLPLRSPDNGKVEYPQSVNRVEPKIQPQNIHFEEPTATSLDQKLYTPIFSENEESAFEYVEAVLLGSGLNWDEFFLRFLSSDQILDPSLFDEVELLSDWSYRKLLFDCMNEVLTEVCNRYFGSFPHVSFVKHHIRAVPKGMDLIHEVWKGVKWHLLNTLPPHSLDQLVKKDMEMPAAWMNLNSDHENIVITIEAAILEELEEETLLSFENDTSGGNLNPLPETEITISID